MRTGLAVSLVSHAILITLGLIGLGQVAPHDPEEIESIAVDIIPVEELSNIRLGSLESEVVETETPSVVDTPKPAEIAERTGNTEQDQPTPEVTPTPTPAPTVQTAPAPEARPEPEPTPVPEALPEPQPEPTPEPEPVPAPEPEPEPVEQDPVLTAPPDETSEPAPVAPKPVTRTAALDQKRAEFQRRQEEERKKRAEEAARKKAEEQARKEAAAKEADRISDIINAENSRGATTGSGGQATLGKPTGQAARLTQSERDELAAQMRACWNVPLGAKDEGITVTLFVELNPDGSVSGTPRITSQANTPLANTTALAAQRAVLRCAPYRLAAEKYDIWSEVEVTFDPRDVF